MGEFEILLKVLLAFGVGLLIGIERGWKFRELAEGQRVAGVRTFSLIGLLGGVSAYVSTLIGPWILLVSTAGVFLFVLSIYLKGFARTEFKGATTEVASVLTFFLGILAVLADPKVVLVLTVLMLLVLGLKAPFHRALERLNKTEIVAFFQMVVLTLLVLPFLPNEGYGPGAVLNPFEIWLMVVLVQGISFFGHFAARFWGHKAGTLLMGFFGGLASTTALTFTAARMAGQKSTSTALLTASVSAGNAVMFLRTLVIISVVNFALLPVLGPALVLGCIGALAGAWIWQKKALRKTGLTTSGKEGLMTGPSNLVPAFSFAFLLAAVMLLTWYVKENMADQGILGLAAISGLVDIDAINISLSKMAGLEGDGIGIFVYGVVIAIFTNSLSKSAIAFVVGSKKFGLRVLSIYGIALLSLGVGLALSLL